MVTSIPAGDRKCLHCSKPYPLAHSGLCVPCQIKADFEEIQDAVASIAAQSARIAELEALLDKDKLTELVRLAYLEGRDLGWDWRDAEYGEYDDFRLAREDDWKQSSAFTNLKKLLTDAGGRG